MEGLKDLEEKYITCHDGVKLHVILAGKGDPIILLHGFPDFWYGWKNVIIGLKEHFRLIVPDTRGINLSDKPEGVEHYKLEHLVEDIKILAEKLGFNHFYLVGHDWGGVIGWSFAFKYPELMKKLVIINAPHPKIFGHKIATNEVQRRASGYIFQLIQPGGEQSLLKNDMMGLKAAVFGTARKKNAFTEEDKKKYLESWSIPNSILCGVNYYRANRNIDPYSGIIEVPTLVIHGMKDNFVKPVVLEGLADWVKDLRIEKIEKSSHWAMHDAPEVIIARIKEFFSN